MPPHLCAYFAGFIDGDGMIAITKKQAPHYFTLQVNAVNTCRAPLDLLRHHFGGGVKGPYRHRGPRFRPIWVWHASAKLAESCLRQLLPYLLIKRERAELALLFRSTFGGTSALTRGNGYSTEKNVAVLAERQSCYTWMKELNRRGTGTDASPPTRGNDHAA